MDFHINQYAEDLDAGHIDLKQPNFPSGYFSYLLYETDRFGDDAILLDVGVAYLTRGSAEDGHVRYAPESTSIEFKSFEK